jgi:hypothetical protein
VAQADDDANVGHARRYFDAIEVDAELASISMLRSDPLLPA